MLTASLLCKMLSCHFRLDACAFEVRTYCLQRHLADEESVEQAL